MIASFTGFQYLEKDVVMRGRRRFVGTSHRCGSATLEVALSLPLLLAFMVAIVWLGASMIAQSQVIVEARHKAWTQRGETLGTGMLFMRDDFITKSSSEELDVGPMFAGFQALESSHDVMVGAWDHNKLPFNKSPNWKLYAIASANAKTGGLQQAANKFGEWKRLAANAWQTIGKDAIKSLTGLGDSIGSAIDSAKDDFDADASERRELALQIRIKKSELKTAEDQLKKLKDDDEKEASIGLIDVYKNRVKRLKADLEILLADQKASER